MGVNTSFTPMCAQQTLEPSEIHLQEVTFDGWERKEMTYELLSKCVTCITRFKMFIIAVC